MWTRGFTVGGYSWIIKYNPDDRDFISLHLYLTERNLLADAVKAQFSFSLVDETDKQEPTCIYGSKITEFINYNEKGYHRFMTRKDMEKSKHLRGDSFTIQCDIVVLNPKWNTSLFIEVPPPDMPRNFTDLLQAGVGTDVVFRVGDETFDAHRSVLAARSRVFRALLFGPMKEGVLSTMGAVVQIDDMDPVAFKAMLGFIYGDSLPVFAEDENESVLLQHLLVAADRYNIPRLRAMCQKKLCEHIDKCTVATIMVLADQHSCDPLKEACYEFLRCPANHKEFMATGGFEHLSSSNPSVLKEMMLAMLRPK